MPAWRSAGAAPLPFIKLPGASLVLPTPLISVGWWVPFCPSMFTAGIIPTGISPSSTISAVFAWVTSLCWPPGARRSTARWSRGVRPSWCFLILLASTLSRAPRKILNLVGHATQEVLHALTCLRLAQAGWAIFRGALKIDHQSHIFRSSSSFLLQAAASRSIAACVRASSSAFRPLRCCP